ncbi:FAD-dependent monooxygenase [Amycolatopsis jiangsuensis]|uniref:2-polyprenyl-6-methoxyphenol hydroxylase-like FAD-dependent oxidoreductase n=1 Tax=Amycolatopsis jiangsuensis TaxID=1181879 RepID=A0A840J3R5_9PSEU|nr:FAD-dependent oxidoreductase [Amycolatopsis jiangsuensis]MBB4688700.1 2-polyprenyl-6-methoxyphenol hydroxylase-like FAD-dependent oxidoreductase [Amycolatopsis jiangsuensis]
MKKPEVLVVGAGIAGPAVAYWLSRLGYRPTVVEQARQLRSGGSPIVVKGPAIPVAERMDILPKLRDLATRARSLTLLAPDGSQILRLPLTSDTAPTVVLLGDAAAATALLGDGSSMAMAGAHALAMELAAYPGDHSRAFAAYEARIRREVDPRQRRVGIVSRLLVPRTRPGLATRNAVGRIIGRTSGTGVRETVEHLGGEQLR